jgi:hypothetical protein
LMIKGETRVKNRKPYYAIINRAVILFMVLFLASHNTAVGAESDFLILPMPQKFIPALQADGTVQYIPGADIEKQIRTVSPALKNFYYNRTITRFIVPEHIWLDHLLGAYDAFLSYTGVQGKADTWDCENYSGMLNAITTLRIWRAGFLDTRAAIGWLRVDAKHSWAGLPAAMHALMFAVTNEGIFIIEPQNGQYCSLSDYPNKKYIEEVYLF